MDWALVVEVVYGLLLVGVPLRSSLIRRAVYGPQPVTPEIAIGPGFLFSATMLVFLTGAAAALVIWILIVQFNVCPTWSPYYATLGIALMLILVGYWMWSLSRYVGAKVYGGEKRLPTLWIPALLTPALGIFPLLVAVALAVGDNC